ncbi:MAG: hypothetical protein JRE63_09700, partial [Deltaproteobacteria bacterium]|nr:hypothetical protein [Deltaproteobacteria bacterium]
VKMGVKSGLEMIRKTAMRFPFRKFRVFSTMTEPANLPILVERWDGIAGSPDPHPNSIAGAALETSG